MFSSLGSEDFAGHVPVLVSMYFLLYRPIFYYDSWTRVLILTLSTGLNATDLYLAYISKVKPLGGGGKSRNWNFSGRSKQMTFVLFFLLTRFGWEFSKLTIILWGQIFRRLPFFNMFQATCFSRITWERDPSLAKPRGKPTIIPYGNVWYLVDCWTPTRLRALLCKVWCLEKTMNKSHYLDEEHVYMRHICCCSVCF